MGFWQDLRRRAKYGMGRKFQGLCVTNGGIELGFKKILI